MSEILAATLNLSGSPTNETDNDNNSQQFVDTQVVQLKLTPVHSIFFRTNKHDQVETDAIHVECLKNSSLTPHSETIWSKQV